MNKFFMLVFSMIIFVAYSHGQVLFNLMGSVIDENNQPLPGSSVYLYPIEKGTTTDVDGNYVIENIPIGTYEIKVSFVGFKTINDTISIKGNKVIDFQLKVSSMSLQEIVVSDNYAETRKREETLNIEVVNDDYLKQNRGGSLMTSLERLPGVSTIDIGSGNSKPVIRGLSFNRVVVVENDIKHEGQQWGADHGLEIDQYAVENVEIIKGPASLEYGSDAIGGVINMNNRKIPDLNSFGGSVELTGKTNNGFLGTSVSLNGRKKWFFASARITLTDYGDYRVPTDSVDIYSYKAALDNNYLRNTAGNEQNYHLMLGIIKNSFQSKFFISSINGKSGFFANAHGLEPRNIDTELYDKSNRDIMYPYQNVSHFKLTNTTNYLWKSWKFEVNMGYQNNFRQEWSKYVSHGYMPAVFPDTVNFNPDLERQFDLNVYSGNSKLSYQLNEKLRINIGFNSQYEVNRVNGRGFIIPAYEQLKAGTYILSKYSFSNESALQFGVRFDYGYINTHEYYDWFTSPVVEDGDTTWVYLQRVKNLNRNFSNTSWSVGYNFNPKNWSLKINLGKSFRMPIAKELAANGVNYHHFSYEIGNSDLSPEISYQLDVGIEYANDKFVIGVTPYLNYFSNYIFLNPSYEYDRLYGNGNQKFYYTESEVFRYGAELHTHYQLFKSLQLGLVGEYVYSEQMSGEKKGFTLPFSPPASAVINLKYQKQQLSFINKAYLSVDYRITAAQNNVVPPEEPTAGYHVFNVGLGGELRIKNNKLNISLQVQNLFNTKYFSHTSYYRLINVPEAGRNFIINISYPFTGNF